MKKGKINRNNNICPGRVSYVRKNFFKIGWTIYISHYIKSHVAPSTLVLPECMSRHLALWKIYITQSCYNSPFHTPLVQWLPPPKSSVLVRSRGSPCLATPLWPYIHTHPCPWHVSHSHHTQHTRGPEYSPTTKIIFYLFICWQHI